MTHCTGYAAAAVGPLPQISAIGIDAERDAPLPDGVLDLIATPAERDRLAATRQGIDGPPWDRLLFSAKEAVYKAWFPLVGEWLDHQEAEILFDPERRTFAVLLYRDGLIVDGRQVHRLHGRWIRKRGILVTAESWAAASAQLVRGCREVAKGTRERSQVVVEHVPVDVVDAVASPLKHLEARRRSPTRMVANEPAKPPATTRASRTWLALCAPPGATTSVGTLAARHADGRRARPAQGRFPSPPPVTELVTSIEPPI